MGSIESTERNLREKETQKKEMQTPDVCLDPKGVLVRTHFTQPKGANLHVDGLKTGERLHAEGINFGRTTRHRNIFFRAPYFAPNSSATPKTIEDEIMGLYGGLGKSMIYIRVDPDKTYVYSSEIRASIEYYDNPNIINKSRKTLTEYFKVIRENAMHNLEGTKCRYHLYTSRVCPNYNTNIFPFNKHPINLHSEILVSPPDGHLTADHFAYCN